MIHDPIRVPEGYTTLPGKLKAAGIEVPAVYSEGLKAAQWRPAMPDVEKAKVALYDATNDDERQAATEELARVYGEREKFLNPLLQQDIGQTAGMAVGRAFFEVRDDLFTEVCERYNSVGAEFTTAAEFLPEDLRKVGALDVTPTVARAIEKTKTVAVTLETIWSAYRALSALSGDSIVKGLLYEDALTIASTLGRYDTFNDLTKAAEWTRIFENGYDRGGFSPLGVHYPVFRFGYLELAPPAEVARRTTALAEGAAAKERSESAFSYPGVPGGEGKRSAVAG